MNVKLNLILSLIILLNFVKVFGRYRLHTQSRQVHFDGDPDYGGQPDYGGVPDYGGQPDYGGVPDYGEQPDYGGEPDYGEQPDDNPDDNGDGDQPELPPDQPEDDGGEQPDMPDDDGIAGGNDEDRQPDDDIEQPDMPPGDMHGCEGVREGTFTADQNSCTNFYVCSNGIQYMFDCPTGTVFSDTCSICVTQYDFNCPPRSGC